MTFSTLPHVTQHIVLVNPPKVLNNSILEDFKHALTAFKTLFFTLFGRHYTFNGMQNVLYFVLTFLV